MKEPDRHRCPKCHRWTCVVRLRDGGFRCNKCKFDWQLAAVRGASEKE